MINLLQHFISARAPCGQECELRELLFRELTSLVDEIWVDPAGNLVSKIVGKNPDKPAIRLMAHMDELSLIVKRINDDGSLRVEPLGGILPSAFGQGPVELLGDNADVTVILSFGSLHTSHETQAPNKMLFKQDQGQELALLWSDVRITTCKTAEELKAAGVHAGTRVVIARSRRTLELFDNAIGSYFLDNRAGIVACLLALKRRTKQPEQDIYFVATVQEEIGGVGACYAARTLPGDITLAVDVGPVAEEYQTKFSDEPIIVYQDSFGLYDLAINRELLGLGIPCQTAIFANYGSDASLAMRYGQSARSALIAFAVQNTHGYEVMHKNALEQLSKLLAAYLDL
ncbi:MAG: hypothetical protein JSS12_09565 [Verrucomicrobia bacterium]|nr:hypothetical protein [Verrucomicrobiota bacterium]